MRLRDFAALAVGAALMMASAGARLWGGLGRLGWELQTGAVVLVVFACAAAFLVWPARDRTLRSGWIALVLFGALGLAAAGFVGTPSGRLQLLPRIVELAGGSLFLLGVVELGLRRGMNARLEPVVGPRTMVEVERGGRTKSVRANRLEVGDRLRLAADAPIPVDVLLIEGEGYVDGELVHGHATPVRVAPGWHLMAGARPHVDGWRAEVVRDYERSFQSLRTRAYADFALDVLPSLPADRWAAFFVMTLGVGVFAAPWLGRGNHSWDMDALGALSGLLAVVPGCVLISAARGRAGALKLLLLGGVVGRRARDLVALIRARRWHVEPLIVAAPGDVDVLNFGAASNEELVGWCLAVLAEQEAVMAQGLRAWCELRGVEEPEALMVEERNGVREGTVGQTRVRVGALDALRREAGVSLPQRNEEAKAFERDPRALLLAVATTDGGMQGLVSLRPRTEPEALKASRALFARLGPGGSPEARKLLCTETGLPDAKEVRSSDAVLLRAGAPRPARGARLRVERPGARLDWAFEDDTQRAPRIPHHGLPAFGQVVGRARAVMRGGIWRGVVLGVVASAAAAGLAWFGLVEPLVSTLIGAAALFLGSSDPEVGPAQR